MDVRLAQLDRAFGYGPKGRGFESSNARIKKATGKTCRFFIRALLPQNKRVMPGEHHSFLKGERRSFL